MATLLQNTASQLRQKTRLIMMGSDELTAGFRLIGFETWPNATEEDLDQLLAELARSKETALVFLEPYLAQSSSTQLIQLRDHGGNIVITEIPTLSAPGDYQPQVEQLVLSILGKSALEPEK